MKNKEVFEQFGSDSKVFRELLYKMIQDYWEVSQVKDPVAMCVNVPSFVGRFLELEYHEE